MSKKKRIFIIVMCLTAGTLLAVLLYDLQAGNLVPGLKGGGTLPHYVYGLALPGLIYMIYINLKGSK